MPKFTFGDYVYFKNNEEEPKMHCSFHIESGTRIYYNTTIETSGIFFIITIIICKKKH